MDILFFGRANCLAMHDGRRAVGMRQGRAKLARPSVDRTARARAAALRWCSPVKDACPVHLRVIDTGTVQPGCREGGVHYFHSTERGKRFADVPRDRVDFGRARSSLRREGGDV